MVLNKLDKINEGQTQLNNKDHYREFAQPMVIKTDCKVRQLVNELYRKNHIDDMTRKWLCDTPSPPCIPIFNTITKIYKPSPTGRLIISGTQGPPEKLSAFVDRLLQPIAQACHPHFTLLIPRGALYPEVFARAMAAILEFP